MILTMCGIGGCVLPRGRSVPEERLARMRDALGHRGPDDSGVVTLGNVGLVHTRLAIVDLSERGHQPMEHPGGDWWLSYNGEIYNHRALRDRLIGMSFRGTSDTETLLSALATWGPDVVPQLTGQFAFAALDLKGSRVLLCRDRFGIKPLYMARSGDAVWFASEPSALIAAGVSATPISGAWDSIMTGSYLSGDATLSSEITRVAAGACVAISLDDARISSSRWYSPSANVDRSRAAELKGRSRSRLTDQLETTLRTAVHSSLLADATVGTLCSGGIDSSLITALAVELKPDIVAFAASFKGDGDLDEKYAAQRVARALDIEIGCAGDHPH